MRDESLIVEGIVAETCHGTIAVDVQMGGKTMRVLCRLAGRLSVARIRCLPGDTVEVELSPYDPSRGRITYRGKRRKRAA